MEEITDGCWVQCINVEDPDLDNCGVVIGGRYRVRSHGNTFVWLHEPHDRAPLWKRVFRVLTEFELAVLNA